MNDPKESWEKGQCRLSSLRKHISSHHILLIRMESLSLIQIKGRGKLYTTSLVAQMVKNPTAIQETQFQSLGWEDSLEKGMATLSGILAWRLPRSQEPGGLQSMGLQSQTRLSD